jgi:hypothetical protein
MSVKREAIACILLVFAIGPVLVQAAAPAQENDMRPLVDVDVWIDQLSWHSYYWTQLDEDDVIYVDFEVTSGSDIDFFICDGDTYDLWSDGNSVTVSVLHENVGSYSTSFRVPSDGEWRVVFVNDNWLIRKHVEGTVQVQSPTSPSNTLLGMAGLGILILVIVGIAVVFHHMGKHTKTRKHVPEYVQPPSQLIHTSGRVRTGYCPHCGQRLRLPSAQFCPSCGASLGPPPDLL